MRRTLVILSLAGLLLAAGPVPEALAQDARSARGTVSAIDGNSITVKFGAQTLTFTIEGKTVLEAEGAGTASRRAAANSTPGPRLADFLKIGEAVEVTYRDTAGILRADRVRKVASPEKFGSARTESAAGLVEAVSAASLTISGASGGGDTFKQTFVIDTNTRVVGQGATTMDAAKAGHMTATDFLKAGDRVTVTYRRAGTALRATEVRVSDREK